MPSQVTNFQCPTCTGPLHYVGKSGRLECEYCGNSFSVQKIEALYGEKIEEAQLAAQAAGNEAQDNEWNCTAGEDWGSEAANLKTYSCPSCGAELVCDQTTAATSCPYCGNPSIVPGQFHGMLKPDYILPFRLDKQAAVTALKNYYKGKHLLPKAFADSNHIEEIKGVYVPFWLFNGEAEADLRFTATRSRSYRHGDQLITEVDHFLLRRAGTVQFSRIPVDASSKMPDAHMDAIEPFDYSELKPFSTAYLPGYLADKYDVEIRDCEGRADQRAANSAEDIVASSATGYESCSMTDKKIRLRRGEVHYVLLPVWMLSTRWNGKSFLFAMNGQTGKLIGDLPVDKGRYWSWFARIALPLTAVFSALLFFL